jgi:hypothetical protein
MVGVAIAAAKRANNPYVKSEVIESAAIANLINADFGSEQTHDERDWENKSVPQARPESSGTCAWDLVFRTRTGES